MHMFYLSHLTTEFSLESFGVLMKWLHGIGTEKISAHCLCSTSERSCRSKVAFNLLDY